MDRAMEKDFEQTVHLNHCPLTDPQEWSYRCGADDETRAARKCPRECYP